MQVLKAQYASRTGSQAGVIYFIYRNIQGSRVSVLELDCSPGLVVNSVLEVVGDLEMGLDSARAGN